jgi:signal transduction histidine kinase
VYTHFPSHSHSSLTHLRRKEAEEVLSSIRQKLIEAQDQERIRIARELHDDIGQRLVLLVMELDQIRQSDPAQPSDVLRGE